MRTEANRNTSLPRIAIVEDEPDLRDNVLRFLGAKGYAAWGAESAESFYRQLAVSGADIVVLDIGLPGEDGLSVTSHLAGRGGIGIIILSARGALDDRLHGMERGADLYLVKPVDLRELVAGIDAVWRRLGSAAGANVPAAPFAPPPPQAEPSLQWRLNRANWSLVSPEGAVIPLTPKEYAFLSRLVEKCGQPVPKAHIVLAFGGEPDEFDFHRVEMLLSRLRRKGLEITGAQLPIKALPGFGLVFTGQCVFA
ncbi:MAG: two component transcriptional regulator, winged helix family [Rhodocyclaceae bacterium]|nr:two component transcriptional regulator, winged helix family [Rhodocyclaceae bacterium]